MRPKKPCAQCAHGKQKVTYSDFYADVQGTDNGPHTQPPDMFRQGALDIGWERLTTLLDKFQHAGIAARHPHRATPC